MASDVPASLTSTTLKLNASNQTQATTNYWYGNGWTAMWQANKWYPGWSAFSFRWYNNCWWVYMRNGAKYKTVYIGPNYVWHYDRDGYWR